MKKFFALFLIITIFVQQTYQFKQDVTSLDAKTVKSPGNFINKAPEASKIIDAVTIVPKLDVTLMTRTNAKNEDCKDCFYTRVQNVKFDKVNKTFYKKDETEETFGTDRPLPRKSSKKNLK